MIPAAQQHPPADNANRQRRGIDINNRRRDGDCLLPDSLPRERKGKAGIQNLNVVVRERAQLRLRHNIVAPAQALARRGVESRVRARVYAVGRNAAGSVQVCQNAARNRPRRHRDHHRRGG